MHWNLLVVVYLFLRGIGSGAFLTSFAAEKGWLGTNSRLAKAGYYISPIATAIAAFPLMLHLGQGLKKPLLLFGIISNSHSVMSLGVYILGGFVIVGLIKGYFVFKNKSELKVLSWVGVILAIANAIYTGLILSAVIAIPFWSTAFLPILAVVSALSAGFAAVVLFASFSEKNKTEEKRESFIRLCIIAVEIIVVAIYLGIMLAGVNGPSGTESAKLLVTGVYKVAFWGYFIVLGLLFPLSVFIFQSLGARQPKRAFATETSSVEEVAAASQSRQGRHLLRVTSFMIIIGDLAIRALIIYAAIPIWNGFILP